MTRRLVAFLALAAALSSASCGIDEGIHNKVKQDLAVRMHYQKRKIEIIGGHEEEQRRRAMMKDREISHLKEKIRKLQRWFMPLVGLMLVLSLIKYYL